jgi:hypothetical protein
MTLTIQPVDTNYISQVWPMVDGYLLDALVEGNDSPAWSDCYNIHHVQGFLTSGLWLLLVAVDEDKVIHGAATVSFSNYPMNRIAFITLIGGRLISSKGTFDQLKMILKQRGATKVQDTVENLSCAYGNAMALSLALLWWKHNYEIRSLYYVAREGIPAP